MQQIKDIMTRRVELVGPRDTIRDAAIQMRDGNFGMMPVADDERLIGAISDRDITIRAVAQGKGPDTPIREVMTRAIVWAYEDEPVEAAAAKMSDNRIRRLPIMSRDNRLVGIVSLGDLAVEATRNEPAAQALTQISRSEDLSPRSTRKLW